MKHDKPLTAAQRRELEKLRDYGPMITDQRVASSLERQGLARWMSDNKLAQEITDAGRAKLREGKT